MNPSYKDDERATRSGAPAIAASLRAVKEHWGRMAAISVALVAPCYWHARIEAGDLASHVYNAWLGQLIERGQAPGLRIARQWDNAMFDVVLLKLSSVVGLVWAEKIAVTACVLIFFWGAFAFIGAASRRAPWLLVPGIAIVAYGWTFQMGFMNYYLSLGFAFAGAALLWRGRGADWAAGIGMAALAFFAHPLGLVWMAGIVVYVTVAEATRGVLRWVLPVAMLVAVFAARYFLVHRLRTASMGHAHFYTYTGADQIVLFGVRYAWLASVMLVLGVGALLFGVVVDREKTKSSWTIWMPLELWALSIFAAAILPDTIYLPHYAAPIAFLVPRFTSTTAVLALCIVGCLAPRRRNLVCLAVCAGFFFVWLHQDTGILNRMEAQASQLVSALPRGQRVTASIWFPLSATAAEVNDGETGGRFGDYFSDMSSAEHIVDRACIGQCYSYGNYEPASQQFLIRASPDNAIVTNSPDDSSLMETGRYVVRAKDLPMVQICQCDEMDLTKLCLRQLQVGQLNGEGCYRPPHR